MAKRHHLSGSNRFTDGLKRGDPLGSLDEGHDDEGEYSNRNSPDNVCDGEGPKKNDRRRGRQRDDHVEDSALGVRPLANPPGGHAMLLGVVP